MSRKNTVSRLVCAAVAFLMLLTAVSCVGTQDPPGGSDISDTVSSPENITSTESTVKDDITETVPDKVTESEPPLTIAHPDTEAETSPAVT